MTLVSARIDPPLDPSPESPPHLDAGEPVHGDPRVAHQVEEVQDYQLTHSNLLKAVHLRDGLVAPAWGTGVSLVPTPFPRRCFDEAWHLQPWMNELYIRAAADADGLGAVVGPLLDSDPLLAALWNVHIQVQQAGVLQDVVCGVFRADYMLHAPDSSAGDRVELKQVEMNHSAVAGACHAARVAAMHRYLAKKRSAASKQDHQPDKLPASNENVSNIVATLAAAHKLYITSSPSRGQASYCILMIVQPFNFNIADERPVEYGLWDNGVPCFRCEWQTVLGQTQLTADRRLIFTPPFADAELEVSVAYFRAGYEAKEYDELGKEARLRLELSRAIQCPDTLTHLTTFKAVQQALTDPAMVTKLLPHAPSLTERLIGTFMPMHVLDTSPSGHEARRIATDPQRSRNYVLKPNLEGGGHNVYRTDIPEFLAAIPQSQWRNYILMRLIEPPATVGTLLTTDAVHEGPVVSELGIVGTCLWRKKGGAAEVEILRNDVAGWTFKTKPAHIDEMSVVKGYGCFDCPRLEE